MNIRILHCGDNLQNYYLCIEKQVAGFKRLSPSFGDMVYLCVKVNGISFIGARFVLDKVTTIKPLPDAKNYKFVFSVKDIQYCKPFEIKGLAQYGGSSWAAKYLQSSKQIKDEPAIRFLEEQFMKDLRRELIKF